MTCVNFILTIFLISRLLYVESHDQTKNFLNFLNENCGPDLSKYDHTMMKYSSIICPSILNSECQSDCKFLVQKLYHKCQFQRENVEIISRTFRVPESCFDILTEGNLLPNNESSARSNYESNLLRTEFCYSNIGHPIPVGVFSLKPCSQVIGKNFEGNVQEFCSNTGSIIRDADECRYNKDLLESVKRLNHLPKTHIASVPFHYEESIGDFIQQVNNHIGILEQIGDVIKKTGVKELVSLVTSIGSFLGPIGAVFSFLGALFPATNKEHQELLNRLDKLEVKINEVSSKIDDLTIHVSNSIFMSEFRQNTMKLVNIEHDIRRFVNNPSDLTRSLLVKRCMDNPSSEMVQWFLHIIQNIGHYEFANMFSFSRNEYNEKFGKPALAYIIRSISAKIKCVGVLRGSQQDIDNFAKDLQQMSRTVADTITYTYENYIPDYALSQTLERDVIDMMRRFEGQSNEDVSRQMFYELERKYDFYRWGVNSYGAVVGTDNHIMTTYCFKCVGKGNSGSYWIYRTYGRCINLMYTNRRHSVSTWQRNLLGEGRPSLNTKLNQMFSFPGVRNGLVVRWGNGLRSFFYSDFMLFHNVDGYASFVMTA